MKKSILGIFSFILVASACRSQQPISKIAASEIKALGITYKVNKNESKFTVLKNERNKLSDVAQITPNLPNGLRATYYMEVDKKMLAKICADAIPLNTLKQLPMGMNDRIDIYTKVDVNGIPIEMDFIVQNTSLITAVELSKIETKMKDGSFKINFNKEIKPYIKGANYFPISLGISYFDILTVKQGN